MRCAVICNDRHLMIQIKYIVDQKSPLFAYMYRLDASIFLKYARILGPIYGYKLIPEATKRQNNDLVF